MYWGETLYLHTNNIAPTCYYKVPNTWSQNVSPRFQYNPASQVIYDTERYRHHNIYEANPVSPRICIDPNDEIDHRGTSSASYVRNTTGQPSLQNNDNTKNWLIKHLKTFTINPNSLRAFGFPTECELNPIRTFILKSVPGISRYTEAQKIHQKECVRCQREFVVTKTGQYVTQENCRFHLGKCTTELRHGIITTKYTCCGRDKYSTGCMLQDRHVWSGISVGLNGPFYGYVKTRPKSIEDINGDTNENVIVLDCEMCYTANGLECTAVSVLNLRGELIYATLVRPELEIVDYNTQYSGLTNKHFSYENSYKIKTLEEVQRDLLQFISADTILIGHGVENDLRALKMIHKTIIDTSILYEHECGFPFKHSLRNLTKSILKRNIQSGDVGHDSIEDCQATLDLVLNKARADFNKTKNYYNFEQLIL